MQKTLTTSLERTEDVVDTLEWKVSSLIEKKLPTDIALSDYLIRAVRNLEGKKALAKMEKEECAANIKEIDAQLELIKVKSAQYLIDNGLIDPESESAKDRKIESSTKGNSVSITKAKEATETETEEKEFVMLITQAELEELLIGLGKGEIRTVKKTKTTNALPAKLRVNAKKALEVEVIEQPEQKAIA